MQFYGPSSEGVAAPIIAPQEPVITPTSESKSLQPRPKTKMGRNVPPADVQIRSDQSDNTNNLFSQPDANLNSQTAASPKPFLDGNQENDF